MESKQASKKAQAQIKIEKDAFRFNKDSLM